MPAGAVRIYGTEKLSLLGRELAAIGGPTARGLRSNTRKAIVASTRPIQRDIQAAYRATAVEGHGHTGLRNALASATQTKILISRRSALVRIQVNPGRMPAGKQGLPPLWEGERTWRKPVFADASTSRSQWTWRTQQSHPTFYPTVRRRQGAVLAATVAATRRTLAQLPKEM